MPNLNEILLQRRLAAMGTQAPNPYHDYANEQFKREDASTKGRGFLGVFPVVDTADPGVTSEFSIAQREGGPDYPSLVPTLNAPELNQTLNTIEGYGKLPLSVRDKALQHAIMRSSQGKAVFAQEGEQRNDLLPMFRRIK